MVDNFWPAFNVPSRTLRIHHPNVHRVKSSYVVVPLLIGMVGSPLWPPRDDAESPLSRNGKNKPSPRRQQQQQQQQHQQQLRRPRNNLRLPLNARPDSNAVPILFRPCPSRKMEKCSPWVMPMVQFTCIRSISYTAPGKSFFKSMIYPSPLWRRDPLPSPSKAKTKMESKCIVAVPRPIRKWRV